MARSSWLSSQPSHAGDWAFDVVVAVLASAFMVLATSHIADTGDERPLDVFGYVLLVAAGASVGTCRRWPRSTMAVVILVLGAYVVGRYPGGPIYVAGWVALFALSWRTDRRAGLIGAAVLCGVLSTTSLLVSGGALLIHLVFLGWSAAAVFLGDALRNRRSYLGELEERNRSLEQTREEEARRRVAEERLRIARDLHDSVAHAMATINVQAGAAAHVVDRRPGAVKPALEAIQNASREVLDELAAMVRVLRDEGDGAYRVPTPGVGQVPDLVAAADAAHLPVSFEVDGQVDAVGAPVGSAVYRIVQESLTNVLRHAPGAATRVVLRRTIDRSLCLEVRNDAGSSPGDDLAVQGSGMGIRGMRERAEATGGVLDAGPRAEGGFRVVADMVDDVIRVVLVDDQPLVRAGFRMLLDVEEDIDVVGEAGDGQAALTVVCEAVPDVVLMDIRMPVLDGLEVLARIKADAVLDAVKVLVLTTFELDEYVFEALRQGASGFLVKHTQPADLVRAVREAAAGEALLSPSVTRRLIDEFTSRPARPELTPPEMDVLTDREREVVALVAQGSTNDEIAAELIVSPATARTHVSRSMVKLHARDRAQLVVFAYQSGLVRPGA